MELRVESQMMAQVSFANVPNSRRHLMLSGVVSLDPWLAPFKESLKQRYSKAQQWIKTIDETEGGLEKFSRVRGHHAMEPHILTSSGNGEVWIQCGQGEQHYL
jgi:hypothetical protein